jgi:hypothetical protein
LCGTTGDREVPLLRAVFRRTAVLTLPARRTTGATSPRYVPGATDFDVVFSAQCTRYGDRYRSRALRAADQLAAAEGIEIRRPLQIRSEVGVQTNLSETMLSHIKDIFTYAQTGQATIGSTSGTLERGSYEIWGLADAPNIWARRLREGTGSADFSITITLTPVDAVAASSAPADSASMASKP